MLKEHDFHAVLRSTEGLDKNSPAEAWLYRGKGLEGLFQLEAAGRTYREGISVHPESVQLHLALGQLEIQRGHSEAALNTLRKGSALAPDNIDFFTALLHLEGLDPDGVDAARILDRALDDRRSDASRSRALFFLGQLNVEAHRDRIGFAFYKAGNRLAAKNLDSARKEYPLPKQPFRMSRNDFVRINSGIPRCPALVVTGLPRSGKSIIEGILTEHSAILPGGEYAGLRRTLSRLPKENAASFLQKRARSGISPFTEVYANHPLAKEPCPWIVDTSPANLTRLGYFGIVHRDTPVILCRRRAMDLGVALYFKKFRNGHGYTYDLSSIGRAIAASERLIEHWNQIMPNPILIVDYENLVSDPETVRKQLFAHIGLEAPPKRDVSDENWRLFPSKSPGPKTPIRPVLLGFADRFAEELQPLVAAYEESKTKLEN